MLEKLKEIKTMIGVIAAVISLIATIGGFGYYIIATHDRVIQKEKYLNEITISIMPLFDEEAQVELMKKALIAAGGG